jgi:hypothetical protein
MIPDNAPDVPGAYDETHAVAVTAEFCGFSPICRKLLT